MCALTKDRPKAEYNCAQKDFYTIVKTGWMSYSEHLPAFMNFKTTYTVAKGTTELTALAAAKALPDEGSRADLHKSLRIELFPLAETCLKLWSDMSSYIRDGFAADLYETKREAAGYGYYPLAAQYDWDSVSQLIGNGVEFANSNTGALTTGGMPATFIVALTGARDDFDLKYGEFLAAEELTRSMTDAKTLANNALHSSLMLMFEDGKKIFRDNASVRAEFTFERILALIDGGGTPPAPTVTKISGLVTDTVTGDPLVGATLVLTIGDQSVEATTGPAGLYTIGLPGLAQTVLGNLTASLTGFLSSSRGLTINPNEDMDEDFGLSPEVPTP